VSARTGNLDYGLLAAVILPLIGIIPTIGDGVIKSADAPLHVHRIYAMTVLLRSGSLWPRWVPWFHLGYGYPVFNFYPPGVFYLGGLLSLLGIPTTVAFMLISALAWVLGSVGTYKLARLFLPSSASLLAAMLWSYAPSRLYEVWHQGSLPQMMSGAFVPWLFWGLALLARKPTRRHLLALALPFAGMVLTHQPVTLVACLFLAPGMVVIPWWLSRQDWKTLPRRWLSVTGGLLLGVGLAAIFLIPLAAELHFVAGSEDPPDTIPYLISNFLQPYEIFSQPLPMDLTDLRFELPTTLGLVGGVLGVLGLLALIRRKQYIIAAALLVATAFMVFMLLEISLPLWERIPFLAQLRFPARLLRVGAVLLAVLGGASILLLPRRWQTTGLALGLVVVLVAGLPLVYPNQQFVNWDNLSALDEINMELAEHNWGTTSYDEFDPVWGERVPLDRAPDPEQYITNPLRVVVRRTEIINLYPILEEVEELDASTTRVVVTEPEALKFHQYYYPGWMATMDGQPVPIYAEAEFGLITVDVPPGEHVIMLRYGGTTAQNIGAVITVLSIGLSVVLYRTGRKPSPAHLPDSTIGLSGDHLKPRVGLGIISAVTVFTLVNTLYITPRTLWFRQQSPPDSPVYMETPVHQSFGETMELLGYTLNQDSVAPGGLLNVMLFWRAERRIDREFRPVVQLVNLSVNEAWAASEPVFPGGGRTTGYPTDRFASEVHSLRLPDTALPFVGRISVQMVDMGTGEPLRLHDGADRVILDPLIRITGGGPAVLRNLDYRLGDVVELWCASIYPEGEQLAVDLYWHTLAPGPDIVAFVHGFDGDGNLVEQNDGPLLDSNYPLSLWLPGQNLADRHTLPLNPAIESVAVGLYTPADGTRLNVTEGGQPVTDNRIVLPAAEAQCQP
jgi:hypothetical protein